MDDEASCSGAVWCDETPVNDDCDDPETEIFFGETPFSTLGATTDGPWHALCSPAGTIQNDIWYTFTAPADGTLIATTCGTAEFNTAIAIYEAGTCLVTDAELLACNDDKVGCAGQTSEARADVVAGQQYLIRLGGASGSDSGVGTITLWMDGPIPTVSEWGMGSMAVLILAVGSLIAFRRCQARDGARMKADG